MKNRETETMAGRQLGLRSSPSCLFVYALLSISVREHGLWPRLRLNSFIGADLVEDSSKRFSKKNVRAMKTLLPIHFR